MLNNCIRKYKGNINHLFLLPHLCIGLYCVGGRYVGALIFYFKRRRGDDEKKEKNNATKNNLKETSFNLSGSNKGFTHSLTIVLLRVYRLCSMLYNHIRRKPFKKDKCHILVNVSVCVCEETKES